MLGGLKSKQVTLKIGPKNPKERVEEQKIQREAAKKKQKKN
jgi:hypothetical protein